MKKLYFSLLFFVSTTLITHGNNLINDPVKDYISNFTFYDGRKNIYSDDRLLRLDLDLNNDGQSEVLLSMGRDRNGKQGNVWVVYAKTNKEFIQIGGMTFSDNRFYLGKINELGKYGLVTFYPGGAGEGALWSYVLNGTNIEDTKIGEVRMDRQTFEYKGRELANKYTGTNAIIGSELVTIIDTAQLAKEYGVKVESKTYRQAVKEDIKAYQTLHPEQFTPPTPSTNVPSPSIQSQSITPPQTSIPSTSLPQTNTNSITKTTQLTTTDVRNLVGWIGLGAVVVGVVTYLLLKK